MRGRQGLWRKSARLLVCFFGCCVAAADAADWPTYRGDGHRSGVSSETLALPLAEAWVYRADHAPRPAWPGPAENDFFHSLHGLSPTMIYDRACHTVVVGDRLYYGSSSDDAVYCLDVGTAETRWTFVTEGPVRLAPTVAGGRVFIGSDDGRAYCLDGADGRLLWTYRAGPEDRRQPGNGRMISLWPVRSGVVVENGVAYFAAGVFPSQGAYLCAVGAADGREIWKQTVDVSTQGYLLATPTRLFIPTGRSAPRAFDRSDGRSLGDLGRLGGSFALVVEDMLVHGGSENGQIYIDEPISRERIVSVAALRLLAKGPMVYFLREKTLSALDRTRYLELSRQIRAIEVIDRKKRTDAQKARLAGLKKERKSCEKWKVPCSAPYEMIAAGDVIFAGGSDQVVAYDAADGKVLWTALVAGKAYGLAVSGGRLFVSTDRGNIHCFSSREGATTAPRREPRAGLPSSETADDAVGNLTAAGTLGVVSSSPHPEDDWTPLYARAAEAIIEQSGIRQGYCLVLGAGTGRLAREIARRTDLRIVGVEEDAGKVAAARTFLRQAGLYGTRIAMHHVADNALPYPKYFANLIVCDASVVTGLPPSTPAAEVSRMLRPCGGVAVFGSKNVETLDTWSGGKLPGWTVGRDGGDVWGVARRGPLAGSGEWTHTYGEPGNSASSGDALVSGSVMDLQWFGRPGPRRMIDRHHRNVPPLSKDGRCFIPGDCIVWAVDAYNGTILWNVEVPESRRLGVFLDASNLVVDDEHLYVAAGGTCYGFDVRTGERRIAHKMPQTIDDEPHNWGYLAYCDDLLFGSGTKQGAAYTRMSYDADIQLWHKGMKLVASDYLFGMQRASGKTLWTYTSGLVVNTTIAIGGGRIYFIETDSPGALVDKVGRMPLMTMFTGGEQLLVGLDMRTGQVAFKQPLDVGGLEQVCYLVYADGVLVLSGSRETGKTVHYQYHAFDARTGEPRWRADHNSGLPSDGGHGEYNRHTTIVGGAVYAWPHAYDLQTGERIEGWNFSRLGHGCGGVSASARSLFWRGGNPWMYDLTPGGGPLRLTQVTRPGCWINIIPAGGLVLIPEASSGCTCPFSIQASMAFSPGLPPPVAAPDIPLFVDTVGVTLTDPKQTGRIRYTLDGSDPNGGSALYAAPIALDETAKVKARTFWEDGGRSCVFERTYTRVEPRAAEQLDAVQPGLWYRYYEGDAPSTTAVLGRWTPVAEGTAERFSLAPARRRDGIGLVFGGFVKVPRDGMYTFYTRSDDGSRLEIGTTAVVDNDGLHASRERSGVVALRAGLHPMTVAFFEARGAEHLAVSWEGPGIEKQEIPPAALFHRR